MKKEYLLFLSLFFLLMSCTEDEEIINLEDKVVLTGIIKNSSKDSLSLFFNKEKVLSIAIDSKGKFKDTFNLKKGYYDLKIGSEFTTVYLNKGYELFIRLNEVFLKKTIQYRGIGEAENNYLAKKALLDNKLGVIHRNKKIMQLDEEQFLCKIDSIKNIKLTLLNHQELLNEAFKIKEQKLIKYEMYNYILLYPFYADYYQPEINYTPSINYPKPLKHIYVEDASLINHQVYLDILQYKYTAISDSQVIVNDSLDSDINLIKVIHEHICNDSVKEALFYHIVNNKLKYVENVDAFYTAYSNTIKCNKYRLKIEAKYKKLKSVTKGNFAPTFSYKNINGEVVSLEDLKGKLIYIDLWATWCGPCISEIPALKRLENELGGYDIEFVSIATNCDKEDWKNMVKEKRPNGIHLYAEENEQSFVNAFLMSNVPRFILLNKKGIILDANAKRPSNPDLKKEILSCL